MQQGERFYLDRLKKYARMEWVEVKPAKEKKGRAKQEIPIEEGAALSRRFVDREYRIALDRQGKMHSSEELADRIERLSLSHSRITWIVGGPYGLSEDIVKRADEVFSLSPMTFTHEMTRIVLLEQIYRAFTILHNEPYHLGHCV